METQDKALLFGILSFGTLFLFAVISSFKAQNDLFILIGGVFLIIGITLSGFSIILSVKSIKNGHKIKGWISMLFSSILPLFIIAVIGVLLFDVYKLIIK
ncbi:hypothetical protein [Aquimarina algiphila]|uniref:hypothetical protein n=1 Tax=Aquimarina algiphila TaxID=2047982 RepID=UPI00232BA8EC|nr:hypothetical protein [Aquimarina algiphila]